MVMVVRQDLGMGKGKAAAQVKDCDVVIYNSNSQLNCTICKITFLLLK